jgi:hypothetical protein
MKIVFFATLILFFSQAGNTQVLPQFSLATYLNEISVQMMAPLGKKIQELVSGGFTTRTSGKISDAQAGYALGFFGTGAAACGVANFEGQAAQIAVSTSTDSDANYLLQTIAYRGCDEKKVEFFERIELQGKDLVKLTESDVLKAKRNFVLGANENLRRYSLLASDQIEIFTVLSKRISPTSTQTFFILAGEVVVIFQSQFHNGKEYIQFTKNPIQANINGDIKINFQDNATAHLTSSYFQSGQIFKNEQTDLELAPQDFSKELTNSFSQTYINTFFGRILDVFLSLLRFPQVVMVAIDSQLNRELELIKNLLLTNPNNPTNQRRILDFIDIWQKLLKENVLRDDRK